MKLDEVNRVQVFLLCLWAVNRMLVTMIACKQEPFCPNTNHCELFSAVHMEARSIVEEEQKVRCVLQNKLLWSGPEPELSDRLGSGE